MGDPNPGSVEILQLRVGGHYRTRSGLYVTITGTISKTDELFTMFGYTFTGRAYRSYYLLNYRTNGRAIDDHVEDPYDLVEHVPSRVYRLKPGEKHVRRALTFVKVWPFQRVVLETILALGGVADSDTTYAAILTKIGYVVDRHRLREVAYALEGKGWLTVESDPSREKPFRILLMFRVTPLGQQVLQAQQQRNAA